MSSRVKFEKIIKQPVFKFEINLSCVLISHSLRSPITFHISMIIHRTQQIELGRREARRRIPPVTVFHTITNVYSLSMELLNAHRLYTSPYPYPNPYDHSDSGTSAYFYYTQAPSSFQIALSQRIPFLTSRLQSVTLSPELFSNHMNDQHSVQIQESSLPLHSSNQHVHVSCCDWLSTGQSRWNMHRYNTTGFWNIFTDRRKSGDPSSPAAASVFSNSNHSRTPAKLSFMPSLLSDQTFPTVGRHKLPQAL